MFETPESSSDLKARQRLVKPPLVAPVWPIRVLAPNWPFTSSQGCCTGPGQPRRPRLPRPVCLLCVQRKKPTLNGSKSTCCTFSQVVGQKLFRTGSCHHRFQVKPLFISRSLLIVVFFFFLVKASCSVRVLGVSTRISVCVSGIMFPENKQPASQRGFQSPQISLRCSQLAPLFQVTDPRRKPRWPETGRSAQRVRKKPIETFSLYLLFLTCPEGRSCLSSMLQTGLRIGFSLCETGAGWVWAALFFVLEYQIVCQDM